jgi:AcrR family transcriptional regulator
VANKPRRVPREIREQQMLDAGVSVFSRHGYHDASVEQIAEQAGISKPMVYLYFGSKEELFLACLRREAARLRTLITTAVGDADEPRDALDKGLRAFLVAVGEHRAAWLALYRRAGALGEPFVAEQRAVREDIAAAITALMRSEAARQDLPDDEVELVARAVIGAAESLADWLLDHPDADPEHTATGLMSFAWRGVGHLVRQQEQPLPPGEPQRPVSPAAR